MGTHCQAFILEYVASVVISLSCLLIDDTEVLLNLQMNKDSSAKTNSGHSAEASRYYLDLWETINKFASKTQELLSTITGNKWSRSGWDLLLSGENRKQKWGFLFIATNKNMQQCQECFRNAWHFSFPCCWGWQKRYLLEYSGSDSCRGGEGIDYICAILQ